MKVLYIITKQQKVDDKGRVDHLLFIFTEENATGLRIACSYL